MTTTKLVWKDESSYSRGDTVRTPVTFEASVGVDRIIVTRRIDLDPTDWRIIFGNTSSDLSGNVSAEAAQLKAEALLKKYAKRILAALGEES